MGPEAYSILQRQQKQHMDEISNGGPYFWRSKDRKAPHNLYTSADKLREGADIKGYSHEFKSPVYIYNEEGATSAGEAVKQFDIHYLLDSYRVTYDYDEVSGRYMRMVNGKADQDLDNGTALGAANIIVAGADHKVLDSGGEAMLFQKGKMIRGQWLKKQGDIIRFVQDGSEVALVPGDRAMKLKKKKDIFFETLENMADTVVQAADYFSQHVSNLQDVTLFANEMKKYESQCDDYVHTIITELNKTFITPIERDDIMELTTTLDDVLDGLEATASRFYMYQLTDPDEYIVQFAEILRQSAYEIQKAIHLLSQKKLLAIREYTIRLNDLENQGDEVLRMCIKNLFATVPDPIELIKRVAKTIGGSVTDPTTLDNGIEVVIVTLIAAIIWNLVTWWFGIPSSSSHALIGALAGAVLVGAGSDKVKWSGFIDIVGGVQDHLEVPLWVKISAATAMALGTSIGGWKIIKTMGTKIFKIEPINGFAADLSAASVIFTATLLHLPVSTTHAITSAILDTGQGRGLIMIRTLAITREHQVSVNVPLTQLDLNDYAWRPKLDYYENLQFLVLHALNPSTLEAEEVDLFLGANFLVSFHHGVLEEVDEAWERLLHHAHERTIWARGPVAAAYTVMDKLVDHYFPSLFAIEDELAELENRGGQESVEDLMNQVFDLRSRLLKLRRTVVPMRDLLYRVVNSQHVQRTGEHTAYFTDIYDHLLKLTDMIEADREMTADLRDSYISLNSNRMNQIMKTLTVITTVFMPLTLIAGIYGMNFAYMPELQWKFGYGAVLLLMFVLGGSMVAWFVKRGWFK
ncbi:hypothetical protein HK101_010258 [Irineochytrium annulatum]|nr:hypothetical protein HK101_010258 [Irineochytrium annulatum]